MLNFYVRHGMIVEKIHEIKSFKQRKWLEKYISFKTQKRSLAKKSFEKGFYEILNNSIYGKPMEIVRSRLRINFFNKITIVDLSGNNQNYLSVEFTNHLKIMIVTFIQAKRSFNG